MQSEIVGYGAAPAVRFRMGQRDVARNKQKQNYGFVENLMNFVLDFKRKNEKRF